MESSLNPETSGFSDDPLGAPSATSSSLSRALWQYIFREDRFFLVLSVFIGISAGLAVVCFRFAIDWSRLYLLGTGAVLTPSRMSQRRR